jgi:hypothetical protein
MSELLNDSFDGRSDPRIGYTINTLVGLNRLDPMAVAGHHIWNNVRESIGDYENVAYLAFSEYAAHKGIDYYCVPANFTGIRME